METLELKKTVTKILTDGFYNRMQIIEENVSKSVDKSIEIIQQNNRNRNRKKKNRKKQKAKQKQKQKEKSKKQKKPEQVLRIP